MLIMTFATKSLSSAPAGFTRLVVRGAVRVGNRTASLVKALVHRRDVMRLGELDERGLKDIGLVRSDIDGALASSWLRDPSRILAARSTSQACVASARREEGLRQAALKPQAALRGEAVVVNSVACGA